MVGLPHGSQITEDLFYSLLPSMMASRSALGGKSRLCLIAGHRGETVNRCNQVNGCNSATQVGLGLTGTTSAAVYAYVRLHV